MEADQERIAAALRLIKACEQERAKLAAKLTPQHMRIVGYIAKGFSNEEIGDLMELSRWTIGDHLKAIYKRLGVDTRTEVAVIATLAGMA